MKIRRIRIRGFKVFKEIKIQDLSNLSVFLGANGSGKSSLFDVFSFLSDAMKEDVASAVSRRGGFKEIVSRGHTGNIVFEIGFRKHADDVTYTLLIGLDESRPVVKREMLRLGEHDVLNFIKGEGIAISEECEAGEPGKLEVHVLDAPDVLALKGLEQFRRFKIVTSVRRLIKNWHISDFDIHKARLAGHTPLDNHLTPTGDNLASVARHIHQKHPEIFDEILGKMRKGIPGFSRIQPVERVDGQIGLQFQEKSFNEPFIARHVSDGTLKYFAHLLLLHEWKPHPLLCVENPENHLHPELLLGLAEEFREYANRGGQVFVSTQSPEFVNALKIDELFWLIRKEGFAKATRAKDDPVIKVLHEAGNPLGSLWTQSYLKGFGDIGIPA